jgi:hypothetical protein
MLIVVMASVVAPNEGGGLNQHKLTKQDRLFKSKKFSQNKIAKLIGAVL